MELTVNDKLLKNLPFLELTRYLIYNKKIVAKKGTGKRFSIEYRMLAALHRS